jgi:drug/metabolite transporter (DMT)-like permease
VIGFYFFFSLVVLSQAATLIRFADAHAVAICFWRLLFASVLLLPLMRGKWREYSRLSKADWWHMLGSGLMLYVHFYFFFRSVQETTIANASILFSLNPVFIALGAWLFFKERLHFHLWLALALGISGVGVLFAETLQFRPAYWSGDLWGLLTAICFSVYILTGKRLRQKISNIPYAFCIYVQTTIYALLTAGVVDIKLVGYSSQTWLALLGLAIFPTLLGHALFTYCLNYLDVNFMSCMTLIEPLLAALVAYYLFAEPFTPWAGVAFLLTVASVLALYWPSLWSTYFSKQR